MNQKALIATKNCHVFIRVARYTNHIKVLYQSTSTKYENINIECIDIVYLQHHVNYQYCGAVIRCKATL